MNKTFSFSSEEDSKMAKGRCWAIIIVMLSFALLGCLQRWSSEAKIPRMTKEELKSMLGHPDVTIVDVRLGEDWKKSNWKIQGAVREDPEKDIKFWAEKFPKDKTLVFYCS
jgi:hypothetical protein